MGWDWAAFGDALVNRYLLAGVWTTVWLSVAAMGFGLVLGLVAALLRLSRSRLVRGPADVYVWLMRGTPLLVQLIIIYTGLPQVGIRLNVVQSALLGFSLNEGAYISEIMRAGILAVSKGQFEAGRALGMPYPTLMRVVILPQAARVIIPPLGNQFNGLLKATSLAAVISMEELLRRSQMLIQVEFRVLEIFTVAALYYLLLTTLWGVVQQRLEAHYGRSTREVVAVAGPRSGWRRLRRPRLSPLPAVDGGAAAQDHR
jgi:polar amino acid transport system permease protein